MQYLVLKWKTTEPRLRKSFEHFAPFFCLNLTHCKEVLGPSNIPEKFFKDSNNLVLVHTMGLQEVHWRQKYFVFRIWYFFCWKILKGLDLHKIETLFLEISVGGILVLSISQRLFSGSLPLMKPCISIEGKRKRCLQTHLQSWAKWLVNQTSTTVLVWFF